jgi:hypothetical protein
VTGRFSRRHRFPPVKIDHSDKIELGNRLQSRAGRKLIFYVPNLKNAKPRHLKNEAESANPDLAIAQLD